MLSIGRKLAYSRGEGWRHRYSFPGSAVATSDDICRDFLRNVCQRGKRCRYRHPPSVESVDITRRHDYTFCHDFRNKGGGGGGTLPHRAASRPAPAGRLPRDRARLDRGSSPARGGADLQRLPEGRVQAWRTLQVPTHRIVAIIRTPSGSGTCV